MDILKKLEAEESKVGLNLQEFRDKKRHKEFITEYQIWKNKQGILPLSSAASKKKEEQEEALKLRKLRTSYRNAVKHLKNFEEHDLETLTDKEKALLRICLRRKQRFDEEQGLPVATTRFDYLLPKAEEAKESKEDSETVKENADNKDKTIEQKQKQKPIATANKTPEQLQQLFQNNKRKLLKEVKRSPLGDQKRLATSGRKRLELLKENVGIDVLEGRILARLPKERLEILFTLSAEYKKKTGKCINEKTSVVQEKEEQKEEALKLRKLRTSYRNAVKYLKNFEEHDLETLTGREKALLRVCLRRKQRFEEEQGLPVAATRFDYLLTEAERANESKEDSETIKENADTKDKTIEQKEKQKPIATANKTPEQLRQLFQNNKRKLLKEVKRSPLGDQKRLPTSGRKRLDLLKENVGIDVLEGRILARLPKERLEILFTLSAEYRKHTGECMNEKTSVEREKEKQKEEALKLRKLRTSYRNAVKYLKNFEEHDLETLTGREKTLLRVCLRRKQRFEEEQCLPVATTRFDYLLTEAKEANESKEDSETVKENANTKDKTIEQKEKQKPIATANKTPEKLRQLFQNKKRKLLKEVKRSPLGDQKRLPTSGRKRLDLLKENVGIDVLEGRILARLPKERLEILFTLSAEYRKQTGECINEKTSVEREKEKQKEEALKLRKLRTSYRNAVKYLKNFEEHDFETLTGREKTLLRVCLRRKQRFEEEQGLPVATTRFDYLLTEAKEANESKEDFESVKENAETKDKTIEQKKGADATTTKENQDEKKEDAIEDLTNEPEDQLEYEEEKAEEQNVEEKKEDAIEDLTNEPEDQVENEEEKSEDKNVEDNEEITDEQTDKDENVEEKKEE